jgi:serine/threonine-protein kinase
VPDVVKEDVRYAFHPFVLDTANRRLLRDGTPVAITARVFDILVVLVGHHGRPVDKDALIEQVWGDTAVEEGNLTRNVSTLRKVLGESPDDHQFIVTLPGRGYQFVAPVREACDAPGGRTVELDRPATFAPATPSPGTSDARGPGAATTGGIPSWVWRIATGAAGVAILALAAERGFTGPGARPAVAASAAPRRIVVLPFKNLGPSEDEYVAAGVTEEITNRIAAVGALRVVSRTSASQYERSTKTVREIGQDLGADYLLEGSVLWNRAVSGNNRVRVTAQLIRVADDAHVWAEAFDREPADLFRMQAELATRVTRELKSAVLASELVALEGAPTRSIEAYTAYLQGRFHASRPDLSDEALRRVIGHFQKAVDLDPAFALAHAALARHHVRYYEFGYDVSADRTALARRAAERARELAPHLPDTHLALSDYWLSVGRDPDQALAAAEAAERLRPTDAAVSAASGYIWFRAGRWQEAAARFDRARQLDPRDALAHATLASVLIGLRRYPEAQHAIERSIALEPDQLLAYVARVWNTWLWKGDLSGSRTLLGDLPAADDWRFMELRFLQALFERRYDEARRALAPFSGAWVRAQVRVQPAALLEAQAWQLQGDRQRAAAGFEAARKLLDAEVRTTPDDGRLRSALAIALAGLGRRDEAVREGRRALEVVPYPREFGATVVRMDVALALAMAGEHDAALEHLRVLLTEPAPFSVQVLQLDPRWDALRGHSKYLELIAR